MDRVVIIGAGGHSKVLIDALECIENVEILGLVDDRMNGKEHYGYKVIGTIEDIERINREFPDVKFLFGIGVNKVRKEVSERFEGIEYYTLIHPSAIVSKSAEIGEGTVLLERVVVKSDSVIGRHTILNTGVIVEHDCVVGDYVHMASRGVCYSMGKIGEGSLLKAGCIVGQASSVSEWSVLSEGSVA